MNNYGNEVSVILSIISHTITIRAMGYHEEKLAKLSILE